MIGRYAKERNLSEPFGDWVIRAGIIAPTTSGAAFCEFLPFTPLPLLLLSLVSFFTYNFTLVTLSLRRQREHRRRRTSSRAKGHGSSLSPYSHFHPDSLHSIRITPSLSDLTEIRSPFWALDFRHRFISNPFSLV